MFPGKSRGAFIGKGFLAYTDPADHPTDEAVVFRHIVEYVERAPAHQPEIPRVGRNVNIDDPVKQPVECKRSKALEGCFSLALDALAVDNVAAVSRRAII